MLLQVAHKQRQRILAACLGHRHWTELTLASQVNALGMVELHAEHAEVGHSSHPAVVDSSMHLSVFSPAADGQTRVPGDSAEI